MSKTLFCSDLHLGHLRILLYEPVRRRLLWERYFAKTESFDVFEARVLNFFETSNWSELAKLIELHDNMIIDNWNAVVGKDDVVWFLGDFCMGRRADVARYKSRLKGIIRMIKGNHDNFPNKVYLDAGFRSVSEYPVLLKSKFLLSHAPIENTSTDTFYVNIFGHVHSSPEVPTDTDNTHCVCIERQNLTPKILQEFTDYYPPVFKEYETGAQ